MLTETFIASTRAVKKNPPNSALPKDASIYLHDFLPTATLKGSFNKSVTESNSLAVTQSHVFAAQADGAIVKVFSREKGNLETFVPFHEHISSLACIGSDDGAAILALGTGSIKAGGERGSGGRLMLWELSTGRLVQTPSSHIQAVTCMAVDATESFILTGSADSQINVWSVSALLSFTELDEPDRHIRSAPLHSFSNHDAAITAVVTGHSHTPADIAISAAEDRRCLIWDYRTNALLHIVLIGETPLCLAIDPADRAFYAGMSDGGVQMVNFHKSYNGIHPLYNDKSSSVPTEASESDRWKPSGSSLGPVCSIDVSYDGTMVLAGYETGAVMAWDVGGPQNPVTIANLAQPVTNLQILPPAGFPAELETKARLNKSGTKLLSVVKPRPDFAVAKSGSSGLYTPDNFIFSACFKDALALGRFADGDGSDTLTADFDRATAPGNPDLPDMLWQAATAELGRSAATMPEESGGGSKEGNLELHDEVEALKARLKVAVLQRQSMSDKLVEAHEELERRDRLAAAKQRAKAARKAKREKQHDDYRKKYMREKPSDKGEDEDEEMEEAEEEDEDGVEDLSDDTDDQ